jgi:hypothetical protein
VRIKRGAEAKVKVNECQASIPSRSILNHQISKSTKEKIESSGAGVIVVKSPGSVGREDPSRPSGALLHLTGVGRLDRKGSYFSPSPS